MSVITDPEEIICEFLRARLTDPRARYSSDSDSFTATAGQTEFLLTPTTTGDLVRAIVSVTKNGIALKKWQDYTIDARGKKIILLIAASLNDAVVINYYASASGYEWIYPGKPISSLGKTNFPRISVELSPGTGIQSTRAGNYKAVLKENIFVEINVWVKDKYSKTINSKNYSEQDLANYLGYQIKKVFSDYIDDLYPEFYDYEGISFSPLAFDEGIQSYRHMQEVRLSGVDLGE